MRNFLITALVDIIVIFISYFIFRLIISGPTRHRLYEKFFSSMSKFVIFTFLTTLIINFLIALVLYKTRYIAYINIIAPLVVSILVGFLMSTVPTRGIEDSKTNKKAN